MKGTEENVMGERVQWKEDKQGRKEGTCMDCVERGEKEREKDERGERTVYTKS